MVVVTRQKFHMLTDLGAPGLHCKLAI